MQKKLAFSRKYSIIRGSLGYADMAELADAHGSGPCEGYFMGVRIPLSAPNKKPEAICFGLFIWSALAKDQVIPADLM